MGPSSRAELGGPLTAVSASPLCRPMLIDMNKVYHQSNVENLEQAFSVAERDLSVTRLLDPEGTGMGCPVGRVGAPLAGAAQHSLPPLSSPDVDVPQPDEKSIITYVSSLYDAMPRVPDVQDGIKANVSLGGTERGGLASLGAQGVTSTLTTFSHIHAPLRSCSCAGRNTMGWSACFCSGSSTTR